MSRFAIQQIKFNGVLYPGITGWSVDPGIEVNSDALDGTVHETAHHGLRTAPMATMSTRDLSFISNLNDSTDVMVKACDGTNGLQLIGGKANSLLPGYAGGSVHVSRQGLRGVLLADGVSWSKGGKAELGLKAMLYSANGTTAALVSSLIALPALPTPDFGYILSALTLNGSTISAVDSLSISCDHKFGFDYLAGLPEPTDVQGAGVNGAAAWRMSASIGDCDLGSGSGTAVAVFTRLANGGGLGSNTLTVTFNTNWIIEEGVGGSAGGAMSRSLTVRPRYNGTTKPVTWAIA